MNLDFLEIGTSTFDTLIETATDSTLGISVEPVKCNLDLLPNKPNVIKVNAAITSNRATDNVEIFYIPPDVIPDDMQWLKGCNTIGGPHPIYRSLPPEWLKLVRNDTVPLMNISEFLETYNVKSIQFLKIDTEGHDCVILNGLFEYLKTRPKTEYPKRIQFETNTWTPVKIVDKTIRDAEILGYTLLSRGYDTELEFTDTPHARVPRFVNGRMKMV